MQLKLQVNIDGGWKTLNTLEAADRKSSQQARESLERMQSRWIENYDRFRAASFRVVKQ